jgi:hypothetical protein
MTSFRHLFIRISLAVLFMATSSVLSAQTAKKPFVIAHMANTTAAVAWALDQGANGIEMDIHFGADGQPTRFLHGGKCDCYCSFDSGSICSVLRKSPKSNKWVNPCEVQTPAAEMLAFLAQQARIELLILDSKPAADLNAAAQELRGQHLVQYVDEVLIQNSTFKAQIVISVATLAHERYIAGVATEVAKRSLQSRILIGFDQEGDRAELVLDKLAALGIDRSAWAAGASACYPTQFLKTTQRVAKLVKPPALIYSWTLDRTESMERYLAAGVQGIITNQPARMRALINSN